MGSSKGSAPNVKAFREPARASSAAAWMREVLSRIEAMGIFDRFFGKGRDAHAAQKAELRGDLEKAAELWGEAGQPAEAARVMILRGDAETDARRRMVHYTQALATAPEGNPIKDEARVKRAELLVAQLGGGAISATLRRDLLGAAADLEKANKPSRAAEVYAMAGDAEGEARALAQAGDVERLEFLLTDQQTKDRAARARTEAAAKVELLLAEGKRREALAAAEALAAHDAGLATEKASLIRGRKATGPVVALEVHGAEVSLVLGPEVVIGRTEGTIQVPSQAVSRQHLRVTREGEQPVVRDLGSRNGTQLRGMNLVGAIPVGDGLELQLGKEVRVGVRPSPALRGAIEVEVAGRTYVAPLGTAVLSEGWRLEAATDGWLELVSSAESPAYIGEVLLEPRTSLLRGDELSARRGGPRVLKIA